MLSSAAEEICIEGTEDSKRKTLTVQLIKIILPGYRTVVTPVKYFVLTVNSNFSIQTVSTSTVVSSSVLMFMV